MTPRCDGCRHFAPLPDGMGDCRRLPPVVAVVDVGRVTTEFPLVRADINCGEHEPPKPDPMIAWERLWACPDHMAVT